MLQLEAEREGVSFNNVSQHWCWPKSAKYPLVTPLYLSAPREKQLYFYLYHLQFHVISSGKPKKHAHLVNTIVTSPFSTPIGLLFSSEPTLGAKEKIDTEFCIPVPHAQEEIRMQVTMQQCTKIPAKNVVPYISNLTDFNRKIKFWKNYTFAPPSPRLNDPVGNWPAERSYLLCPLVLYPELKIDEEMLRKISCEEMEPYLTSIDSNWVFIPFVGQLSCLLLSIFFFLMTILCLAPYQNLPTTEKVLAISTLSLSILFLLLHYKAPNMLPDMVLLNSFFTQTKEHSNLQPFLYAYSLESTSIYPPRPRSRFCSPICKLTLTPQKNQKSIKYHRLDLNIATFEMYYRKKYGIPIRYTNEELIPTQNVKKHADFDLWTAHSNEGEEPPHTIFIIPELVKVHPLKRNVLYLASRANSFLPSLERKLHLLYLLQTLQNLSSHVQSRMPPKHYTTYTHSFILPDLDRSVLSLLNEATSLSPCITYQRLEFIGDAVLAFFLSIQVFSQNFNLEYNVDDLGEAIQLSVTNVILKDCSIRNLALDTIIHRNMNNDGDVRTLISDHMISDIMEALLAAAFFMDECMVIGLLDLLNLPLALKTENHRLKTINQPEDRSKSVAPWYAPLGTCLQVGYPFQLDKKWFAQLVSVGTTIHSSADVLGRLEKCHERFSNMFFQDNPSYLKNQSVAERCKILLMTAFFDDSLGYESNDGSQSASARSWSSFSLTKMSSSIESANKKEEIVQEVLLKTSAEEDLLDLDDSIDTTTCTQPDLVQVAMLRDSLYVIGNYALHLCISKDIFLRYPNATAGDLHMMKTMALSDDVLAYVMVKNHIDDCLYDVDAPTTKLFMEHIVQAELAGEDLWKLKGTNGWFVPNGILEFNRRKKYLFIPSNFKEPRYVGLAGGRLCHHGHSKIDENITTDLVFSFKAIIGALVLSIGLENMHACVGGPLLEELYLVSPDEARHIFGNVSNICKIYKRGYESSVASAVR